MPVVIMRASDFGLSGYESIKELEENEPLKQTIEAIRLVAGEKMQLGDVSQQTIPKMCLIAPPIQGGVHTRMLFHHVVHEAIGVLAAVSVATNCKKYQKRLPNTLLITPKIARLEEVNKIYTHFMKIKKLTLNPQALFEFTKISKGEVYISI
jgi:2-methylaconitate cis-trans-isomerase PrpF